MKSLLKLEKIQHLKHFPYYLSITMNTINHIFVYMILQYVCAYTIVKFYYFVSQTDSSGRNPSHSTICTVTERPC